MRILKKILKVVGALLVLLVALVALLLWWTHPKRPVNSIFVREAGPGVFKFTDIPKGRVLSPEEVDGYARKLLAEMTLPQKVLQMSGDSSLWDLIKLITIEKGKYNDYPITAGTDIKVCGITRLEDALCAASAGVDALGFSFYQKSPRYIAPDDARQIIDQLPPFIDTVGVFVDQEREAVEEIIRFCRLGYVQLHGQEPPKYCERLLRSASPCEVIKAFREGPPTTAEEYEPYVPFVKAFLLDTYDKQMSAAPAGALTGRSSTCSGWRGPISWPAAWMRAISARPCRPAMPWGRCQLRGGKQPRDQGSPAGQEFCHYGPAEGRAGLLSQVHQVRLVRSLFARVSARCQQISGPSM